MPGDGVTSAPYRRGDLGRPSGSEAILNWSLVTDPWASFTEFGGASYA